MFLTRKFSELTKKSFKKKILSHFLYFNNILFFEISTFFLFGLS